MNITKFISIVTLTCFVFCSVLSETLQASLNFNKGPITCENLEDTIVPQSYGRITDSKIFDSRQIVINIQDLHCHAEVQRNISKILSELDQRYGLKNVYVEGGYGNIDTSWICGVKDAAVKKQIMESLVDQGRLTGSEYYSGLSNRPDLLKGIEDEAVHKANIVRLGRVFEIRQDCEQKIKELGKELEFMQARYSSTKNMRFSRLIEQHRAGGIESSKYYSLLSKYVRNINENPARYNNVLPISMDNYPNIGSYLEIDRAARQLDYTKVTRQLQQFLEVIRARAPYSAYSLLIEKTGNFSKQDELYSGIARISRKYNLDLANNFPDLNRFIEYSEQCGKLNPVSLIQEEKRLTEEIRIGLSQDISDLEVSFLTDFFGYFRDYLLNKISADDYKYFKQRFEKFDSVWNKYSYDSKIKDLTKYFGLLNDFYECNCRRNECFIKNLPLTGMRISKDVAKSAADNTLSEQLKKSEIIVVITGGFHTEDLKKILRDRQISYLAVTPNITTGADGSGIIYAELAKQQAKLFGTNALALALGSMGAKVIDIDKDRIIVELNGERIQITADEKKRFNISDVLAKIEEKTKTTFNPQAVKAALSEFNKITAAMEIFVNPLASTELIYKLLKTFAVYGAQKDLFGSDGLIFKIANDRNVQEAIENYEHVPMRELSAFPEILQQITADNAVVKENLLELAKSPIQRALVEAIDNPFVSSKLLSLGKLDKYALLQMIKSDALEALYANSKFKVGPEITETDRKNGMIDLHMHDSDGFDGTATVEEQIQNAVDAGDQVIQLTNHDTVFSLERAEKYVNEINKNRQLEDKIVLVPAVEIELRGKEDNGAVKTTGIEIVASNINVNRTAQMLAKYFSADKARLLNRVLNDYFYGLIASGNFKIDLQEADSLLAGKSMKTLADIGLSQKDFIIRPLSDIDLAELKQFLTVKEEINPSRTRTAEGVLYRVLTPSSFKIVTKKVSDNIGRAVPVYQALMGKNFSLYGNNEVLKQTLDGYADKNEFMSTKRLIFEIHKQGGKAILTHPMRYFGIDRQQDVINAVDNFNDNGLSEFIENQINKDGSGISKVYGIMKEYKSYGLDGISVNYLYSGTASRNNNLNRIAKILADKLEFKYLPAGETDCHGPYLNDRANIVVGTAGGVPDRDALIAFKKKWFKAVEEQEKIESSGPAEHTNPLGRNTGIAGSSPVTLEKGMTAVPFKESGGSPASLLISARNADNHLVEFVIDPRGDIETKLQEKGVSTDIDYVVLTRYDEKTLAQAVKMALNGSFIIAPQELKKELEPAISRMNTKEYTDIRNFVYFTDDFIDRYFDSDGRRFFLPGGLSVEFLKGRHKDYMVKLRNDPEAGGNTLVYVPAFSKEQLSDNNSADFIFGEPVKYPSDIIITGKIETERYWRYAQQGLCNARQRLR